MSKAICIGNGQLHDALTPDTEVSKTLNCLQDPMKIIGGGTEQMETVVRRLTPLECERLQMFPDGWTDIGDWTDSKGKVHKAADTPRYKALGNSIALPFWFWLLRRISAEYETPATLGSLFDGIGGFPLCFIRCNGTDSVKWASEVDEFCMAVTRKHFGDEDLGIEGDIKNYL